MELIPLILKMRKIGIKNGEVNKMIRTDIINKIGRNFLTSNLPFSKSVATTPYSILPKTSVFPSLKEEELITALPVVFLVGYFSKA